MKIWYLCGLMFVILIGFVYAELETPSINRISEKSQIVFLNKTEAAGILKTHDDFIAALSPFDRSARLKTNQEVNPEDFLSRISEAALDWNRDEIKKISAILDSIRSKISKYKLNFPEKITIIKTTGDEEGKAAYCRGNSIILPQNYFLKKAKDLEDIIIHELFHIYSRNNPIQKDLLYGLIGFKKCPELTFPEALRDLKITNPDAFQNNYYITLTVKSEKRNAIPVLYSKKPYNADEGKEFFDYLQFDLLEVEVKSDQCLPVYRNNKPSFIIPNPSYFDQIGYNTDYIISPEEILADNFVKLINQDKNVVSKFVPEGMRKILNNSSK